MVRTHLAKSQRRVPTQELPEDQSLENVLPDRSEHSDPGGGILREEAERELRAAMEQLPERTRTVLALRYYNNMEYHTIASTLGLSLGNVKTLIHRGKIALAQKMRERKRRRSIRSMLRPAKEVRMHCSSCEPVLDRYLEGTLAPARMAQVAAHLKTCEPCTALLSEVKVVDALLFTTAVPELPQNFTFAVMAELQSMPAPRTGGTRIWRSSCNLFRGRVGRGHHLDGNYGKQSWVRDRESARSH